MLDSKPWSKLERLPGLLKLRNRKLNMLHRKNKRERMQMRKLPGAKSKSMTHKSELKGNKNKKQLKLQLRLLRLKSLRRS